MMHPRLGDNLNMYRFGIGSIFFALEEVESLAQAAGEAELEARCAHGRDKARAARQLQFDWARRDRSRRLARPEAVERDQQVDRTLSQIYGNIKNFAGMERESPVRETARRMQAQLFPFGVFEITSKTFEEEHSAVKELLRRLRADFAVELGQLALEPLVDDLEWLNARFGEELQTGERLTWDEVQAAVSEAEEAFYKVVFDIFGRTLDDPARRDALLAPISVQNERIGQYMKRRGSVPKVDPGTGAVVEGEVIDEADTPIEADINAPHDTQDHVTPEPAPVAE
ncbi:DUF6261 family protein [Bradymonas sediminis]|uniref:DUF6261 family protein n=1 Tax=Bradymonas sediminis TaxID=1548548 RepID=UPI00105C4E7D|nr:DUF6261 family protein [Bradymonas sediminis]TDP63609.1 hypothetical protein DFR33_11066 [Bradymonas sediminis]